MRFRRAVAGAALAGGVAAFGLRHTLRRTMPRAGLVRIAGLDDEIEILRDRWGVPHVYARTEHDLFFGNGVVHAEERLWQMELQRRAAHGRLSEVFGEATFEVDRFMRRIGLGRAAAIELPLLDDATRQILEAYAAGANWVMETRPLPIEFTLTRHRPEPWTVHDSLAWAKLFAWTLSVNWDTEIARARLVQRLGPETAAMLDPLYPKGGWLITGGEAVSRADSTILESYRLVKELTGLGSLGGSNAWAVAPSRSATGRALLANDVHLGPQMPSIWYELSLDATDAFGVGFRVAGASTPGIPGVPLGHNAHIAWGITASLVDVQDLFVERVDPANPHRFARGDGWEDAVIVREEIRVKGRRRWHVEEVVVSSNGPVVSPLVDGADAPLSLRTTALESTHTASAFLRLNRAANWTEFREALRDWGTPSLSFVYADDQGNIGYQLAGLIPKRGAGDGSVPAPGWDPAYTWGGHIPFDELPYSFNPPEGFVATANNRPTGDSYPYPLGSDWCDAYRVGRIVELLRGRSDHDPDSMAAIQLDVRSNAALAFVERIATILDGEEPIDPLEREAMRILLGWNGDLTPESIAATIYQFARSRLLRFLYGPLLGDLVDLYLGSGPHRYVGSSSFVWRASSRLIDAMHDPDWPEKCGHKGFTWRDVIMIGFGEGITDLRLAIGEDVGAWEWGRLRRLSFQHPLGRVKALRPFFSRGNYPIGGDTDTPMQIGAVPWKPDSLPGWVPTYRQIVDLGDIAGARSIHTSGQSGHPASRHYDDFIKLWLRGEYHPMLWARADVERHLESETRLLPTDELWPRP